MSRFYGTFPSVTYNNKILTDIGVRIKLRDSWLNDQSLYYNYIYKEYDKPEHIAVKYYKDESLHWIILLTNGIFDHNFEFPMSETVFKKYITNKYKDNYGIGDVKIIERGNDYIDGIYEDVPVSFLNETDLEKVGKDAKLTVTISSGKLSNISSPIFPGEGYDINSRLTIDNSYLGGSGYGIELQISNFCDGYQYALLTPDPIYRYQKIIRMTYRDGFEEKTYVIDERSYIDLYDDYPSKEQNFSMKEGLVKYYVYRRFPQVSIFQHEYDVNEEKRTIKILKKEYIEFARRELLGLFA